MNRYAASVLFVAFCTAAHAQNAPDVSPHKIQFVTADKDVKLEVLDWGGTGRPLVFLAGLGNNAHVFDKFAPEFIGHHHVYAITRRGFRPSSVPPPTNENYDADRLGDDVLAVIDALKLDRPVLAGHSIAGEELSSVGTRHPEKVSGLVYLDAIYQYSFYDPEEPDLSLDTATVRRDLDRMFEVAGTPAQRPLIADIQAALPSLQKSLQDTSDSLVGLPDLPPHASTPEDEVGNRIFTNTRKYGVVKVPLLAILARPHNCGASCDKPFMQRIMAAEVARDAYFEKNNPGARVVRLHGSHYIWRSNEAEVLREMNGFMDGLPKP
jgi:pimeloyl-ACP methyl ester carboxylesterase